MRVPPQAPQVWTPVRLHLPDASTCEQMQCCKQHCHAECYVCVCKRADGLSATWPTTKKFYLLMCRSGAADVQGEDHGRSSASMEDPRTPASHEAAKAESVPMSARMPTAPTSSLGFATPGSATRAQMQALQLSAPAAQLQEYTLSASRHDQLCALLVCLCFAQSHVLCNAPMFWAFKASAHQMLNVQCQ